MMMMGTCRQPDALNLASRHLSAWAWKIRVSLTSLRRYPVQLRLTDEGASIEASVAAAAVGSGVLISYSAPRPQREADCAALDNRRMIQLMPLQPLAPPIPLRWVGGHDGSERNWVLFQRKGNVFAVFSVEPHIVLNIRQDGHCEEQHRTSNRIFARRFANRAIHGGANPLLVRTTSKSYYFVSIMHTKDKSLQYENYAYTFAADPPYSITAISRHPLTLRGRRVRFVSSLTYLGHHRGLNEALVAVSYGSDDVEGRLAVLPLRVLLRDMQDVTSLSALATAAEDHLQLSFESATHVDAVPWQKQRRQESEYAGKVSDPPGPCFLMHGVRYDASSIKMIPGVAAAQECCALCRGFERCNSFSWSPADAGTCYLKQWSGTAVRVAGYTSGHFARRSSCGCDVTRDVAPNLLNSSSTGSIRVSTSTHEGCCAACLQRDDCSVWTWSKRAGASGSCALFSRLPSSTGQSSLVFAPMRGYVSGVASMKRRVLFVHNTPPQQRLGSDRRLLALLQQVQRTGFDVFFAGADDYDPGPVRGRALLAKHGIPLLAPVRSSEALAAFIKTHDVSVVVLCLWFWGPQSVPARYLRSLRTNVPNAKLVIMSDDVHHLRLQHAADDEGRSPGKEVSRVREEETRTYFYADHVLAISQSDKASMLASLSEEQPMHESRFSTLRHVYADGVLHSLEERAPFRKRFGLVFVGNLNNPTNLWGMVWFLRQVWPRVRASEPRMTLHVVGSLEGETAAASGLPDLLRTTNGVDASGYVSDEALGELLQRKRLFIAPIRWATGIVTKQTLAHVHGIPTVITPVAAAHVAPTPLNDAGQGDAWSHRLGRYESLRVALVASSPTEYAQAILHAHRNQTTWEELSLNGARFARSGGGGKGVCPKGLADDWRAFWSSMETAVCTGSFTHTA